jgi:hypothetical protein
MAIPDQSSESRLEWVTREYLRLWQPPAHYSQSSFCGHASILITENTTHLGSVSAKGSRGRCESRLGAGSSALLEAKATPEVHGNTATIS